MLIKVNVPTSMSRDIDRLVQEGRYSDHGSLIRVALNNLLAEESVQRVPFNLKQQTEGGAMQPNHTQHIEPATKEEGIPDLQEPPKTRMSRPLDYLAVRLLPARVIATHLMDYLKKRNSPRANLAKLSVHTAQECVKLKSMLARFDDSRDVKLSTGFPDPSPISMQRFIQVYVGGGRGGMAYGILASLGLVGFSTNDRGQEEIGFTERGYRLATTESPLRSFILGETDVLPDPAYNDREFEILSLSLLEHSGETPLIKTLMELMKDKDVGRNEVNATARAYFEQSFPGEQISLNVINTHAAATVLRLRELGIVEGSRQKRNVRYQLTNKGREWAKEVGFW